MASLLTLPSLIPLVAMKTELPSPASYCSTRDSTPSYTSCPISISTSILSYTSWTNKRPCTYCKYYKMLHLLDSDNWQTQEQYQTDPYCRQRGRPTTNKPVMVLQQIKMWSWVLKGDRRQDGQTDRPTCLIRVRYHDHTGRLRVSRNENSASANATSKPHLLYPEDGGNMVLRNDDIQPRNYTASQPIRPRPQVHTQLTHHHLERAT